MTQTVIELTEHGSCKLLAREMMPASVGETLWKNFSNQVDVEFPSPKTGDQWQLSAHGWVGHIPLSDDLSIWLKPKVPLGNLFGMLEWAYRLKSFKLLEGLTGSLSLPKFYERLANVLAKRVRDRSRRGLYRSYLSMSDRLPYVRGRLAIRESMRMPWSVKIHCDYEEITPDIEDNQILAWTLNTIARSGLCSERVLPNVRKAYHTLRGAVTPLPCSAGACSHRSYNRLNEDYHPMHALCRFFLDHLGPSHMIGDRQMLPFLVNMPQLFELFVAEWLLKNLRNGLKLDVQEKVRIGGELYFKIDLVIRDRLSNQVLLVLDTKYKAPNSPSPDDIAQVVAYAESEGCREAVLLYPRQLSQPYDSLLGRVRVRSLAFALDGDLDDAGRTLLAKLDFPAPAIMGR